MGREVDSKEFKSRMRSFTNVAVVVKVGGCRSRDDPF